MQRITEIAKTFQKSLANNSPVILTAIGVTGTVSTAILTSRAAFLVGKDVNAGHYEPLLDGLEPEVYDTKKLVKTYWKEFIPPVAVGVVTIVCIISANHISSKRSAALVTAYSLTEKAFSEYKDKVVEQIGATKEQKVRDSIAEDKVHKDSASSQIIIVDNGDVLCYETLTGRYFKGNVEKIRKAQNDINAQIMNEMYASLNDFNRMLDLPATGYGEQIGWNTDKRLEVLFTTILSEDQRPCLAIGYRELPFPNHDHLS